MSPCSVCNASPAAADPRTAQPLCSQCRRLPLRQLVKRLIWKAATELDASDRTHAARLKTSDRLRAAMRHAAQLVPFLFAFSI